MHTTYIVVVEIQSPGQQDLEVELVKLAKVYKMRWQAGPREFTVSPGTAAVAAMTKDNAPAINAPTATSSNDNAQENEKRD